MYAIVTSIFFVFILIFGAIAFVGISRILGQFQAQSDDESMRWNHIQIAKDRILGISCYTNTLDELELNETCDLSSDLITGYRFQMYRFRNCTNETKTWNHGDTTHFEQRYKYLVAIRSNETGLMCPGDLFIYS